MSKEATQRRRPSIFLEIRKLLEIKNNAVFALVSNYDLSTINHCTAPKSSDKFETSQRILEICRLLDLTVGVYSKEPVSGARKAMKTGDGCWVVFYDWPEKFEGLAKSFKERY